MNNIFFYFNTFREGIIFIESIAKENKIKKIYRGGDVYSFEFQELKLSVIPKSTLDYFKIQNPKSIFIKL